ncbi:hypothetical protein [Massilia pseudoviolaceinigra]|uniref:hypothetical protein n=1 Tax=Massilia pseudoviolaceinigra TaxID=3057165 RepID=UPI002796AA14|nr:hypothetical protein [Massilia sp. CCM 9206]MDQ1921685.1 hypothetical protein [Massilia sp. CCM 9206]
MSAARVFTEAELEQIEEDRLDALRFRFLRNWAEQVATVSDLEDHHFAWAAPAFVGATFQQAIDKAMLKAGVAPYA